MSHALLPDCRADAAAGNLYGANLSDAKLSRPRKHAILLWPARSLTSCEQPARPAASREHVWHMGASAHSLESPLRSLAQLERRLMPHFEKNGYSRPHSCQ